MRGDDGLCAVAADLLVEYGLDVGALVNNDRGKFCHGELFGELTQNICIYPRKRKVGSEAANANRRLWAMRARFCSDLEDRGALNRRICRFEIGHRRALRAGQPIHGFFCFVCVF